MTLSFGRNVNCSPSFTRREAQLQLMKTIVSATTNHRLTLHLFIVNRVRLSEQLCRRAQFTPPTNHALLLITLMRVNVERIDTGSNVFPFDGEPGPDNLFLRDQNMRANVMAAFSFVGDFVGTQG